MAARRVPAPHVGSGHDDAVSIGFPPGPDEEERAQLRAYAAVVGHHLASLALNDAMPALPIGQQPPASVEVGGASVDTGLDGVQLGLADPTMTIEGDHLQATGLLDAVAAP